MKPFSPMLRPKPLLLAALLLWLAFPSLAAQTKTNSPPSPASAPTNALPAQLEIPKSVFLIPTTPLQGKDPFFPRSMRLFTSAVVSTNVQPTPDVTVELKLKGISGILARRLAIINNRTFEANEEGAVSTASGLVRIRCLEIRADSVLVQIGGEQRILRLRPGS
jgi:hypothetical protein